MDSGLLRDLEKFFGPSSVLFQPEDVVLYEYDGSVEKGRPDIVVFPTTTQEVSQIVKLAAKHNAPIVGRGAGTGLSGGALARTGGVMIVFARMNRILSIDPLNQRAVVQPGVVNFDLSLAAGPHGLYFAPDPSSQKSCTVGGNVAENAGGPHTLAYGVTTNHVTALELVLPDGEVVRVGSAQGDTPGYDLTGLVVGSEGTLALVTEITVKLSRKPEAVAAQARAITEVSNAHHAREVRLARDNAERELLWKGRKNAFGALGRLAPSNYVLDGVIPRTKLPQTLRRIRQIGTRYGFDICNIFHAGDGNLHPIVLYDPRDKGQFEHAMQASAEIIRYCVEVGGALTGEHGIGMEKSELMPLLFSDADFDLMRRVHDAFNPACLLNPGKIFPLSKGCGEIRVRSQAPSDSRPSAT